MRYRSSRNVLYFLARLLRRVLAWRRPALVPVPVRRDRPGLTIVEMLVTLAITLVMMGAVVNLFANIGQSVNDSRAAIEMSSMLRSARQLLQHDLAGATCPTLPWTHVDAGLGYFEITEGPRTDSYASLLADGDTTNGELDVETTLIPLAEAASGPATGGGGGGIPSLTGLGDFDDVLALTVRSHGVPFIGRFGGGTIESNLAEIIWFAVENPDVPADSPFYRGEPGMRTVYRRVLLIAPSVGLPSLSQLGIASGVPEEFQLRFRKFYRQYDVSAHLEGEQWVPNSLSDLTKPEYRFAHSAGFPTAIDLSVIRFQPGLTLFGDNSTPLHPFGYPFERFIDSPEDPGALPGDVNNREGEDIVLTDAVAFDVRVFDPTAPLIESRGVVVKPGDPEWNRRANPLPEPPHPDFAGRGAYVDLGYRVGLREERWGDPLFNPASHFSMQMHPKSQLHGYPLIQGVYDTWSFHYETDGVDQNRDGLIDEGTDGIDNPPRQFGVDDIAERETSPPYPVPLRAVEVRLRTYERDSRQVREVSVRQSFVPQ